MNSDNNGKSTVRKVLVGAALALAALVLILFAAGRLDGFFSADDLIYDDSSQEVSDSFNEMNSMESSESSSESTSEPGSSTESSINSSDSGTVGFESGSSISDGVPEAEELHFRNKRLLEQHYQKHGIDMGFASAGEYEKAAAAVVNDPEVLHKIEAEDGDDVYYIERTNEFVVVSTDGYLRTYFNPDRGKDYFDRQ